MDGTILWQTFFQYHMTNKHRKDEARERHKSLKTTLLFSLGSSQQLILNGGRTFSFSQSFICLYFLIITHMQAH